MIKIVIGKVIKIKNEYILVQIKKNDYKCYKKNVSDYNCDLKKMFKINNTYKFFLIKDEFDKFYISYKTRRPKLLKNRTNPIATISGFRNLSNNMHKHLKEYKIDNTM